MQFLTTQITLAVALGLGVNALPQSSIGRVNSFEGTCSNMHTWGMSHTLDYIDVYILAADCQTEGGDWVKTSISLGRCIANQAGNIVGTANGHFQTTCKDASLTTDTILRATCGDGKGGFTDTQVRLSDFVFNKNGILGCFDQMGGEGYLSGLGDDGDKVSESAGFSFCGIG
ncbi:Cyanovirin-N [Xylariaceae sp. FL1019]|nr:Cyanovirin-N [Xylariaceae sp. FL1019]